MGPGRIITRWLLLAGLTLAGWGPCLWGLQALGGYQGVAANHQRYVVGPGGALTSASRQFAALGYLESSTGRFALLAGVTAVLVWSWLSGHPRTLFSLLALAIVGLTGLLCGTPVSAGLLALGWAITCLLPSHTDTRRSLGAWLLLAWLVGLSLATPCYTPYPRLALPWLMATWLASGAAVGQLLSIQQVVAANPATKSRPAVKELILGGIVALLLGCVIFNETATKQPGTPRARREPQQGMQIAARDITREIRRELGWSDQASLDQVVVYLYGEPALLYQLRLHGVVNAHPVQDLGFAKSRDVDRAPTFLVVGDRTLRDPGFASQQQAAPRLQRIANLTPRLPPLVWLDEPWERVDESGGEASRPYGLEVLRAGSE